MKLSLFTTLCLSMALAACGQPVQDSGASVETGNSQSDSEPLYSTVGEALEAVPEARPYIDQQNGQSDYFDYGTARADLGAAHARELRAHWRDALSDARAREL